MPYQEPKRISWKVLAVGSAAVLVLFAGAQVIFSNGNNDNESVVISTASATPSEPAAESVAPIASASPETTSTSTVSGPAGVNIELVASRGATWLYATNEDGKVLFSGMLRKGNSKNFIQPEQVNLRVGNAGGVDISVNGEKVGSVGANGEVVNLTYNAD
jgi:cytoskeletal protein RodZ